MTDAINFTELRVTHRPGEPIRYTVLFAGRSPRELDGPTRPAVDELARHFSVERGVERGPRRAALAARLARLLLPPELERLLRHRGPDDTAPRALAVDCADPGLASIPWESLPRVIGLQDLPVVRLSPRAAEEAPAQRSQHLLLTAGWMQHRRHRLPEIGREIAELSLLRGPRLSVTSLLEPSLHDFTRALADRPSIVHLAHPCLFGAEGTKLLFAPSDDGESHAVSLDAFASLLAAAGPRLLVLNARHGGEPQKGAALCRSTGAATVMWHGPIEDALAADFALRLARLLTEGVDILDAVRSFASGPAVGGSPRPTPLLFLPELNASALFSIPAARSEVRYRSARGANDRVRSPETITRSGGDDDPTITLELTPAAAISPALLRNGRPILEQLAITSSRAVDRLELSIECDAGRGSSMFRQTLRVGEGRETILLNDVVFPILYELLHTNAADRRALSISAAVRLGGRVLAEVTQPVLWMGACEWVDRPEMWSLVPAFVRPHDPGVLRVFDHAVPVLRSISSPGAAFLGYQGNPSDVALQLRAIFQALRDDPLRISYMNPPGGPVYTAAEGGSPSGQRVRFPEEILAHRRGTCHDLALLFAGCAEHVGIYPLVILMPSHTFTGFWTSAGAHDAFWADVAMDRIRADRFGGAWTIDDWAELSSLISGGEVVLLESTLVANPQKSYDDACVEGRQRLDSCKRYGFDAALDVWASRPRVQPI